MAINISGEITNFPKTTMIVSFRYFFTLEKEKEAPSSVNDKGVAIFEISLIVLTINIGSFILKINNNKPKKAPMIRGFVTIP